ncbi:MAG TPA: lactate racemase domain-containing protein [Pseudacidobacterium sp.]|jgi:nickel-dependent lactate racemase|nr:lactate racemase domain-containing protein [Pseudacidobacterium sp.]
MALYLSAGSSTTELTPVQLKDMLFEALGALGERKRVLIVPPDQTRAHSRAGELTRYAWEYYGDKLEAILPALGTHSAMSPASLSRMFCEVPHSLFHVHNWRTDIETLGEVPSEFIREKSEGRLNYAWPAQVNKLISGGGFDLVLSIGQVVPHEVIGMANYNKNILVGTGGRESINRSHYLGAVYGMERIMGRADNPVRQVLNYASDKFLKNIPIVYIHTVVSRNVQGRLAVRGLFIGDDVECFHRAADLSLEVNFEMLDKPIQKAVVYLEPHEFKSTWLGNKAIYRTRMALADGGDLIVLAPGVKEFGEDPAIDKLIRKYGYLGTPNTLTAVDKNPDLTADLSAAAHLIHGSSERRFNITYCPGSLSKEEIESVGFRYADLASMSAKYNPAKLKNGYNRVDGEEIFFISNPGLGLWAYRGRFKS